MELQSYLEQKCALYKLIIDYLIDNLERQSDDFQQSIKMFKNINSPEFQEEI